MPSAIDYDALLKDYLENGSRLVRGIMVLCPEIQILALVTNETPLLSATKVDEMILANEKLTTDFFGKATKILSRITEKAIRRPLDLLTKYIQRETSLLEELGTKKLTKEEFDEKDSALWKEYGEKSQIQTNEGNPLLGKNVTQVKHALNRFGNTTLINFAREANLKLYSSTDMVNFKEFSA